jgi:hypothetical protein
VGRRVAGEAAAPEARGGAASAPGPFFQARFLIHEANQNLEAFPPKA